MRLRSVGALVDVRPLRHRAFAWMYAGSVASAIGNQMTLVAVDLQLYRLTGSTLVLAMLSAAALGPALAGGLLGGALADRIDRRMLAVLSAAAAFGATAVIAVDTWLGWNQIWLIGAMAVINSGATTLSLTTRSAIIPRILPMPLVPAASALNGLQYGLAFGAGPALAGWLVSLGGFGLAYLGDLVLFAAMFLGLRHLPALPPLPAAAGARPGGLVAGFRYLRTLPLIRAGFLLDLAAMCLGQPRVLIPAIATVVLHGDAATAGLLLAAPAVGTLVSGVFSARFSRSVRHGRGVMLSVIAYGAAMLLLGVVLLVVSRGGAPGWGTAACLVLLAVSGFADNSSAVYRQMMLQAEVDDRYRGRMQGIFTTVVTGGPRIGDVLAGSAGAALSAGIVLGSGAMLMFAGVAGVGRAFPQLWRFRREVA